MKNLLWVEHQKIRRTYLVWIAILSTMIVAIFIFIGGQDMGYGVPEIDKPGWLISLGEIFGTFFALPAIICLFGSYTICREEQENILNTLRIIPVDERQLIIAKLITTFFFSEFMYILLFIITSTTELLLHFSAISLTQYLMYLKSYVLDGLLIFLFISPIMLFVVNMKQNYWVGFIFTEIICIGGLIASSSSTPRGLYPITAALTLSGFTTQSSKQLVLSGISLAICVSISVLLLKKLKYYCKE